MTGRSDEVYLFINNEFAIFHLHYLSFHYPSHDNENKVGGEQLCVADAGGQSIDDRYADNHEQISHFSDWHCLGSVTHNAENGKQAERQSHLQLLMSQQEDKQKYGGAYQHESVEVIAAFGFAVVEPAHDDKRDDGVEQKTDNQFRKTVNVDDWNSE
jgi:hypothetical protein